MSRIIAGAAGGLRLASVEGQGTRPTTDRVKEAVFSRLESYDLLQGAAVLDLYAGSGALGLEALSRGAARADFVESHAGAARTCQQNVRTVLARVPGASAQVHRMKAESYAAAAGRPVDVVLADPPYDVSNGAVTALLADLVPRLAPGAVVVLERGKRTGEPEWPAGLVLDAVKSYGETVVFYVDAEPSGEADAEGDAEGAAPRA